MGCCLSLSSSLQRLAFCSLAPSPRQTASTWPVKSALRRWFRPVRRSLILAAQIDLSVGSVLGLAGVIAAGVLRDSGSAALAILAGLGVGAACGWVNGIIVAKGKVAAFIVTLATLGITNGLILIYTGARPIAVENDAFASFGEGKIEGIPFPIILAAIVYLSLWLVLKETRFGRSTSTSSGGTSSLPNWPASPSIAINLHLCLRRHLGWPHRDRPDG